MRTVLGTATAALALVLVSAGPAAADSVTVPGAEGGDITKMFVDNGAKAVTVRVFGLPGPCSTRSVDAVLSWASGPGQYRARGACYGGSDWATTLEYLPEGDAQHTVPVRCKGFTLTHERASRSFRATFPRTCLPKAPNKLRAASEGTAYSGSAIPDSAGPTRLLARG